MNGGEISGNTLTKGYGGGVYVLGTFTMNGGAISGNTVSSDGNYGGGVYVEGTFIMNNGKISGNTINSIWNLCFRCRWRCLCIFHVYQFCSQYWVFCYERRCYLWQ